MTDVFISEPPTTGMVLLKTTVGDINVELWAKETPKTCRNFIQLCLEGYYDNTTFHRVVKGSIVQGGDPKGDGTGGESIYGEPFKNEFHDGLRFGRRGLLAMANGEKDDNRSQFFFTLGPTPEYHKKNTIFGKVTEATISNLLILEDVLIEDERPLLPDEIIETEVLNNPFDDIVPRIKKSHPKKKKKNGSKGKMKVTVSSSLSLDTDSDDDFEKPRPKINKKPKKEEVKKKKKRKSQIDKNKEKKSPIEKNNLKSVEKEDLSELQKQTIEPKKFVFKKVKNKSVCSNEISTNDKSLIDDAKPEKIDVVKTATGSRVTNEKPEETSNFSDDDYMDDATFESFLASQVVAEPTSSAPAYPIEDFDLEDDDWNEEITPPVPLHSQQVQQRDFTFSNRKDDSDEFRNIYPHTEVMNRVLHQKFGLEHFRPHQKEIINASLTTQHDCFVMMPTGSGKSLCYQLPAILIPGITIVISPLRALITEQVDKLKALDIQAAHLYTGSKKSSFKSIFKKLQMSEPDLKMLYLLPAKISSPEKVVQMIKSLYSSGKLSRFVIDEAHCLSQRGHDFRPDYKELSCLRKLYPKVPITCLSATATKQVQDDVIQILDLKNVKTFTSTSFNRPNIKYVVIPKNNADVKVIDEISNLIKQKLKKKSGIMEKARKFCKTRNRCSHQYHL